MYASDPMRSSSCFSRVMLGCLLLLCVAIAGYAPTAQSQSIWTYHYDNLRTGWNFNETILTPQNAPGLQLLTSVPLDEQVTAQPLLVRGVTIPGQGTHDVLYVATENDTVYALDATTGAILLTRNFGQPVAQSALPGQCSDNGTSVGIHSTPVIDLASSTMYVMVYTYENSTPIYRLHALDLTTLSDKVTPAIVSASSPLSNGQVYNFNPSVSRQRSGLVEANGNIYAAFASFCDLSANLSRGWLLGWQSGSLKPLSSSHLDDQLAKSNNNFFLSSIWMSGYGVAADPS
jgi:PQQ-like domain